MRVTACSLQNFASYKELNFEFKDQGLTLIAGPTGSGKSTLCDVLPWTLFGITSKGGKVDEILSWPGDEVTCSSITIDTGYTIVRSRGRKAGDNDLLILNSDGFATRGKDLLDTQRLINTLLGMTPDLYLAGAYYHEFSQTAQFFTTTAKNRRAICEQLVDLSLATKLSVRLSDEYRELSLELNVFKQDIRDLEYDIAAMKKSETEDSVRWAKWNEGNTATKAYVAQCYEKFEDSRTKTISGKCAACGTMLAPDHVHTNYEENPHAERLIELEYETNPFSKELLDKSNDIKDIESELVTMEAAHAQAVSEQSDVEQLQDVVQDYRSVSIKNTISYVETQTNRMLTDYFDAEIKVAFSVESADKLDVTIYKDGNEASYTQLSKGQRQLLKLTFGIAVMQAVQNHHGLSFGEVFFDEALDGMDEVMKAKAFRLFESLERQYSSIYVVEHSEGLKARFLNSYSVRLENGQSQIEKS
jgi:DNA repair exonuclease SbcCD ATPase subunit